MLFGNRAFRYIKLDPNPDAAGAGGGGAVDITQQQQQQTDTTMQQQQQASSEEISLESFADMWSDNPKPAQQQQQQQQQVTQQQQQPAPADAFAKHMESLNLSNGVDLATIQTDMQEGKTESLQAAFQQVAQNTYRATMMDMNNVVNQRIEAAVQKAVSTSSQNHSGAQAIEALNKELPFTADPAVAPMAQKAFKQFISKGQDVKTAIESTKNYFAQTFKVAAGDLGIEETQETSQQQQQSTNEEWIDNLFGDEQS